MAGARAAELGPWLDLGAVRGEAAGMLRVEREEERIPEQLRRFLWGSRLRTLSDGL
jgi:hypothetical protein